MTTTTSTSGADEAKGLSKRESRFGSHVSAPNNLLHQTAAADSRYLALQGRSVHLLFARDRVGEIAEEQAQKNATVSGGVAVAS
ncbi:hypothetical protein [Xanthomonas arboricola]|uniref:hypothetical protein n=1 Tax=Xanthomonas arboricola TaxID=56448 RepID=UPI00137A7E08|nr:hypothetical protein [Xanthomonas arboricola]